MTCTNPEIHQKVETINVEEFSSNKKKVNLSDIASKIEYIKFEDTDSSILGDLRIQDKEIKFFGNNILVSSGKILRFDSKGVFLNEIGVVGEGPNEYLKVSDFTFFTKGKDSLISIYSDVQKKIVLYNLNGQFVKYFRIKETPMNISSINNKIVLINAIGMRLESNYYALNIISVDDGSLEKNLLFKEKEKNRELATTGFNTNYIFNDTLSYWESNYDTIWRIADDYKKTPKYVVSIGDNVLPVEKFTNQNVLNFDVFSRYERIQKLYETKNFIFIKSVYQKYLCNVVYNKQKKEGIAPEFKRPFGRGKHFSFFNDIDGGLPFWPLGRIDDNKVFMLVYGYEVKEYMNRNKESKFRDENLREKLLSFTSGSKITDNPALMIVTLKD